MVEYKGIYFTLLLCFSLQVCKGRHLSLADFVNNPSDVFPHHPDHHHKSATEQIIEVNEGKSDILESETKDELEKNKRVRRVAKNDVKWPKSDDGFVYVPYQIDDYFISSETIRIFLEAGEQFRNKTCIRFRPKKYDDPQFVWLIDGYYYGTGCSAHVGMRPPGTNQMISLDHRGCITIGIAIHECMHVIGFYHTMSRLDRDKYMTIHWNNIQSGRESQFYQHQYGDASVFGKKLDLNSVMMYPWNAFSIDRSQHTITKNDNPDAEFQPGATWTDNDIEEINRMYECHGYYNVEE